MRKGSLIWENAQIFNHIYYEEAVSHIWLCNRSHLNSWYIRKIWFSFLSVWHWLLFLISDCCAGWNSRLPKPGGLYYTDLDHQRRRCYSRTYQQGSTLPYNIINSEYAGNSRLTFISKTINIQSWGNLPED